MKKLNKKAFSIVELILIIFVAILLVGAGFYIYNRKNRNNALSTGTDIVASDNIEEESQPEIEDLEKEDKYLEVEEMGIKLKLTNSVEDAYYAYKYNKTTKKYYARLSTRSVDKYPACSASKSSEHPGLASISVNKVGDDNAGSPFTEEELEKASKLKVDDKYYLINGSQFECTGKDKKTADKVSAIRAELINLEIEEL